jgi:hypothetical protein
MAFAAELATAHSLASHGPAATSPHHLPPGTPPHGLELGRVDRDLGTALPDVGRLPFPACPRKEFGA